jgi:arylsulfatase A-like enzyme
MTISSSPLLALVFLLGSPLASSEAGDPVHLNFIIILADDLGYGDLACYGVPADQTQFTQRYTQEGIRFITENRNKPFFLYLPHNMVHIPVHASAEFAGKSKLGIYSDAIQELDWSTGEILKTPRALGLEENTLVLFMSDNGPHLGQGGNAGTLRGEKGSTFEGGVRVPCIMRWPGRIPGRRVIDEPTAIMDVLPTLVTLAGGEVPTDRVIDGKDIWPVIAGADGAKSPHEVLYYLSGRSVKGVRMGDWKYLVVGAKEISPEAEVELDARGTQAAAPAAQSARQRADESGAGKSRRRRDAFQPAQRHR